MQSTDKTAEYQQLHITQHVSSVYRRLYFSSAVRAYGYIQLKYASNDTNFEFQSMWAKRERKIEWGRPDNRVSGRGAWNSIRWSGSLAGRWAELLKQVWAVSANFPALAPLPLRSHALNYYWPWLTLHSCDFLRCAQRWDERNHESISIKSFEHSSSSSSKS